MKVAYEAHLGQQDKTGVPYIFHPYHLAEQMRDETSVCVALLHDVVEDTALTFEDLEQAGFPPLVLDALRLLTHDEAVPYMEYVKRIKESGNATAIAVKLADLHHNSDQTRMDAADDPMLLRWEKYKAAIALLEGLA